MTQKKKIKSNVDSEEDKHNPEADEAIAEKKATSDITENKTASVDVEDPIKELEEKLKATEQEAKETYDRLLRVSAEFENY